MKQRQTAWGTKGIDSIVKEEYTKGIEAKCFAFTWWWWVGWLFLVENECLFQEAGLYYGLYWRGGKDLLSLLENN